MRFDKGTAAVLRPLPAFGLLFPHLCSFSPCLADSELFYFLKYPDRFALSPFHATIDVWNKDVKLKQSTVPMRAGVGFMRRRAINWK
jgi:hypothetical protein